MDEDDFGDDDLDAIPDNTLQQLEKGAFTSTQQAKADVFKPSQRPRIQTYKTTGLSRNGNASKNAWRPPQPRKPGQQQAQSGPPASAPEPPSSDYGFDDEDVIDLDEPSVVMQPTSGLPTRQRTEPPSPIPMQAGRFGSKPPLDPETEAAFAAADAELGAPRPGLWAHAPHLEPQQNDGIDVSGLQARIAELEAEQVRLRQLEQEARDATLAKQGEISIVRANQHKAEREYERRIAVMQKLHANESAKQKAELEVGKKEREKIETDNRFLQHDLAQEAERAKRLNGPGKARAALAEKGRDTPKKDRKTTVGDGFDDDEVRLVSPSKSKDKSREQTPKIGAKRKRAAQDSPIAPLVFMQPSREASKDEPPVTVEVQVVKDDGRYAFMEMMLNHCPYEGHERSVEALTKHAFPSDLQCSLSSMLMTNFTRSIGTAEDKLPLKLSRIMLKLWRRCLNEKYYKPFYLILDVLRFALRYELSTTISQVIEEAVPLCLGTFEIVASRNVRACLNPSFASSADFKAFSADVSPDIDLDEVVDFLKQICDAASLTGQNRERFWRSMDFEASLLMLNKANPISQLTIALQIWATSALPMTFGPICDLDLEGGAEKQAQREAAVIERLTSLLFDTPIAPNDEPPYTDHEVMELRTQVLEVLRTLCLTDHGGLLLAQYRTAIGRLVRFLDAQVNRLYSTRSSLGLSSPAGETDLHTVIAQTINMTTRLIYHLLRSYPEAINLVQKLSVVKGGWHRFLVSMTRIAFSDRLVFEEGLEEEVAEAAHQILDSVLSPEEGEAVVRAVETPRGTKGTSTEKGTESEDEGAMEEDPG